MFESFVNSERCKTLDVAKCGQCRLRALLIQKDVKQIGCFRMSTTRLRALLIQKDVKQHNSTSNMSRRLRALLIQKDVKRTRAIIRRYQV